LTSLGNMQYEGDIEDNDNGEDDNIVDDNGVDDNGVDDNGVDDNGVDDNGVDDNGVDDNGVDNYKDSGSNRIKKCRWCQTVAKILFFTSLRTSARCMFRCLNFEIEYQRTRRRKKFPDESFAESRAVVISGLRRRIRYILNRRSIHLTQDEWDSRELATITTFNRVLSDFISVRSYIRDHPLLRDPPTSTAREGSAPRPSSSPPGPAAPTVSDRPSVSTAPAVFTQVMA